MEDDVPEEEKKRRHELIDELQSRVSAGINSRWLGQTLPVLVEEQHKGKWRGRTPHDKIVFFEDDGDWRGKIADVEITWTGPWSMQGRLPSAQTVTPADEPLVVVAG
jgi:tRNA-2-methylthio-N6-dimethylallyladenosine synthase